MEYYSVIKKKEILPFVTIQMKFEGIMLSEKSQRKANNVWSHLYMESKKQNKNKLGKRNQTCGYQRWKVGWGGDEEKWIKSETFCYKMSKY